MIKYRSKFNRVRRAIRLKIRSAFHTMVIKPIVEEATGMLMHEANQQVRMAVESKEVAEDITCLVDKATSEVDIDALVRNKIGDPDWLRDNVDIDRMVSDEIAHADIETKVRDEIDNVDIDGVVTSHCEGVDFVDLVRESVDFDELVRDNVDFDVLVRDHPVFRELPIAARLLDNTVQERVDKIVAKNYEDAELNREIKLGALWFVFGNNGPAHTDGNHKYIQRHVEGEDSKADLYDATEECKAAVRRVLVEGDHAAA